MTIKELQEKSNSLQAELHKINDELTKVNDEIYSMKQIESILWKPNAGQTYYTPFCGQYDGMYKTMPLVCDKDTLPPIDAFKTEEQCKIACDYLNRIMPVLKYAIENEKSAKMESGFWSANKYAFEIFFINKEHQDIAFKLHERMNNEIN